MEIQKETILIRVVLSMTDEERKALCGELQTLYDNDALSLKETPLLFDIWNAL